MRRDSSEGRFQVPLTFQIAEAEERVSPVVPCSLHPPKKIIPLLSFGDNMMGKGPCARQMCAQAERKGGQRKHNVKKKELFK